MSITMACLLVKRLVNGLHDAESVYVNEVNLSNKNRLDGKRSMIS